MKYQLTDLIDMEQFQMLQDRLNEIYSFPSAIIDNQGTVLTATAWQDICTKFHRRHKECEKECIKSDQYILEHIHEANPAVSYECPHGLIDNATPIIIDGVHYGNFFTGQFFLEKPDIERFRIQAKKYGFDETEYLKAVKRVPIWTKKQLENYLYFIKGMIEVISGIGLKRLRELEYQKKFADLSEFNAQVVNSAQDGIIIYDTDLKYQVWNPQMEKISGVCADKVLGKTPLEVFPFLKDAGVIDRLQKALKGEQTESAEFSYNLPESGRSGWASDTSGALRNNEGEIIGIIGVVRDITERKIAEQALRESEGRYRRLFEQSNDAVFIHDLRGRIFDANDKACAMMGYSHEELLSLRLQELHPEQVLPQVQTQIDLCREAGEVKFETQFKKSDQRIVEVEVSARVIVKDKEIVQGIVRDITERKKTEQSLQESEERFRSLFGSMKEGVAIHKLVFNGSGVPINYELLDVNPQYEAIVGIKKESVVGKLATEIYSTEAPPYLSEYSSVVLTNQQMEFDTYFMPLDKHFHISATNMGRSRFATIFTDITDRINAEREKEQLQKQLLHAQKIQAIGQLAGGIAHDFNNMLGIIMGNAQLLKTSSLSEVSESEEVSEIIAAAQRSRDLTSKLLLFARKDTVKKAEAVFVREIISTIQGMLKRTVPQNIVITSQINDECKIKCDVSQITQALLNICINAVDAMPTGGNLIIECRNEASENGKCSICGNPMDIRCCAIEISDTGTGMPQDYID
jgi:PAS domain S-box-containing protein